MKTCRGCGVGKPLVDFHRSRTRARGEGRQNLCKACCVVKNKAYWESLPGGQLAYKLKSKYGMTLEEFDEMLAAQDGVCAVCGDPPRGGKRLHVDHDHSTGAVRGLLHGSCNRALGLLGDSAAAAFGAGRYLEKSRPTCS